MSTLTIRLPATKHQRLKDFARARGVSMNKLVEEWATVALAQLDAENHYRLTDAVGAVLHSVTAFEEGRWEQIPPEMFDVARIQRAYIHAVSWAREAGVHLAAKSKTLAA